MECKRLSFLRTSGTDLIKPWVYGCSGFWNILSTGPSSITCPAYMTTTRSHVSATTPKSCVISITAVLTFHLIDVLILRFVLVSLRLGRLLVHLQSILLGHKREP